VRSRLLLEWLLVAGLAVFTLCLLVSYRLTERPDNLAYDALMKLRPTLPSDVVIVAIDESSLRTIGRWPWPRDVHTQLIGQLAAARPAAIGYDVLFVEPSADDDALADAIGRAGNVVLPVTFTVPGVDGAPFELQPPVPPITQKVRAVGHADLTPDQDGIVRRASLLAGDAHAHWPDFAEQIHRILTGRASPAFLQSTHLPLPADRFGFSPPILIPFSGSAGFHRTVSLGAVLRGEVPPELLRGKVVLVGSTASGSGDQYPVPSGAMPGVEILANLVDALIDNRAIRELRPETVLVAALVPLCLLLAALLLMPPRVNVVLGLALMALVVAVSGGLLLWADIWLPPTAALAGLMIVYPLWAWRRLEAANAYMVEELTQLRGEADTLPMGAAAQRTGRFNEAIARQTSLLHIAIGRVRDLRRFFADSLQALPDATLVTDEEGEVLVANRAADALFGPSGGLPLAALLGRLAPDLTGQNPADGAREIAAGDGRIFVLTVVPLNDALGNRAGSIARLTDITEIRLATRQREDALQLLTHDMRSPQASILALLDRKGEDEKLLRTRIAGYARRTLKLADDFVHYARAESGQHAEELLDFASILVEAADDQWALAQAKKIRVETPADEEEFLVLGDRSLLSRMLCNLIGNAIKYSDSGTTVRCALEREAATRAGPEMLLCRVADQGHGIAPEDLDAIFRPFHRSRGAEGSGAGLGLAFVRTVVQRHGGAIEVESALGEGTTFSLRLPIAIEG
jgi:CHASE2 domain-containing sensor protein/two-component sensor histidine kinase